jgi:multicomponent Na+:H+ antiporter subunit C
LYLLTATLLLVIGLFGLLTHPHLLKKLLGLNIMAAGIFLLLVAVADRGATPDPVPHALVLTGIVVSVSATAFGVALAIRLYRVTGRTDLDGDGEDNP